MASQVPEREHLASSFRFLFLLEHVQSKVKLSRKEARESDIAKALVVYDKQEHPGGETLPTNQRVYRIKVVTA